MKRKVAKNKTPQKQEKKSNVRVPKGEVRPTTKLQQLKVTEGPEGRVKRHGKLTNLGRDKDGYQRITIKGKSYRLHRIILNAFEPCPGDEYVIDHKNNIHDDNRISNLRWVTIQQNSKFAGEMGLQSRIRNSDQVVICIEEETGKGYMFNTVVEVCKYFTKLNPNEVSAYLVGKRKTLKGYKVVRVNGLEDKRNEQ